jgi:hypothetical protein
MIWCLNGNVEIDEIMDINLKLEDKKPMLLDGPTTHTSVAENTNSNISDLEAGGENNILGPKDASKPIMSKLAREKNKLGWIPETVSTGERSNVSPFASVNSGEVKPMEVYFICNTTLVIDPGLPRHYKLSISSEASELWIMQSGGDWKFLQAQCVEKGS